MNHKTSREIAIGIAMGTVFGYWLAGHFGWSLVVGALAGGTIGFVFCAPFEAYRTALSVLREKIQLKTGLNRLQTICLKPPSLNQMTRALQKSAWAVGQFLWLIGRKTLKGIVIAVWYCAVSIFVPIVLAYSLQLIGAYYPALNCIFGVSDLQTLSQIGIWCLLGLMVLVFCDFRAKNSDSSFSLSAVLPLCFWLGEIMGLHDPEPTEKARKKHLHQYSGWNDMVETVIGVWLSWILLFFLPLFFTLDALFSIALALCVSKRVAVFFGGATSTAMALVLSRIYGWTGILAVSTGIVTSVFLVYGLWVMKQALDQSRWPWQSVQPHAG